MIRRRKTWIGWVEAIALPAVALVVSSIFDQENPLLINQPFPWLWIAPVLIALRYGILPGLLSIGVLMSSLLWSPQSFNSWAPAILGGGILTVVCGEFARMWHSKNEQEIIKNELFEARIEHITNNLYISQISHSRLEQNLIYKPISLRSSLQELKQSIKEENGVLSGELARRTLYLINQNCGVYCAAIYKLDSQNNPIIVATLGDFGELNELDQVYLDTIESRKNHCINNINNFSSKSYISAYIIPDNYSESSYILIVSEVSFFSIDKQNFQVIAVIFQYVIRQITSIKKTHNIFNRWPDCPLLFAHEFMICAELKLKYDVDSALIIYEIKESAETIIAELVKACRGLDTIWIHSIENKTQVIFLLPFSGSTAIQGHKNRIEQLIIKNNYDIFSDIQFKHKGYLLDKNHPIKQLDFALTGAVS